MMSYDPIFQLPAPPVLPPWAAVLEPLWTEDDHAYHLRIHAPDFRRKDLHVDVRGRSVVIRGCRERGIFERQRFELEEVRSLPDDADPASLSANLSEGTLHIRVAKLQRARKRKIKISVTPDVAGAPPPLPAEPLEQPASGQHAGKTALAWLRALPRRLRTWTGAL